MHGPAVPLVALLLGVVLGGCVEAPDDPAPREGTTPEAPAPGPPTSAPPPPEPLVLPDDDRTFTLRGGAREAVEVHLLVNATDRVMVTLHVWNAQPVESGYGVNVLATGPNGTRMQDSGMLYDGGAAFALRLSPLGLAPEDGPARLRVRVSATVPFEAEGRVHVDGEVPEEGGSTVPSGA